MEMFKITVGNLRSEFSVVGIANVSKGTAKFQGQLNGVPFTEGEDYEKIRARVMKAVALNSPQNNEELS